MTTTSFLHNAGTKITLKLVLIFVLVIFLMIPKFMILDLINERQLLSEQVKKEVAAGWANDQIVTCPTLVIPYNYITKDKKGNLVTSSKSNLILYPETININGTLDTSSKYRSLYKVLLYQSKLKFGGKFKIPELKEVGLHDANFLFEETYITIGISDLKGIQNTLQLKWNDDKLQLSPGLNDIQFKYSNRTNNNSMSHEYPDVVMPNYTIKSGLTTPVNMNILGKVYNFSFDIDIKGSNSLIFSPMAKTTNVNLQSSFPHPSFFGEFLPTNTTNKSGFDASWKILEYNKSLPSFQKLNNTVDIGNNTFGVKIEESIDNYSKTHRAGKYMILFVILTFLVVFLTEVVERINIHIFQYTLIGLALAIFFTLLLSISEFWGFNFAYSLSATATITLIFLYSLGMFKSKKSSGLLLVLITILFSYIYIIIQLEKTALLAGSSGLFVIIASTMYVTRKIKWFEESKKEDSKIIESTEIN